MITVHDHELCNQVLGIVATSNSQLEGRVTVDSLKRNTAINNTNTDLHTTRSTSSRLVKTNSAAATRINSTVLRTREWLSRKSRRNVMLLPPDPELLRIQSQCKTISDRESSLIQDIETFLDAHSAQTRCKKEMLFKQWTERVFEPLQSALRENAKCIGVDMDAQRRAIFDKYLDMTNKTNIFLDTIDAEEYNPMLLMDNAVPAKAIALSDPLTMQQVDHLSEEQLIKGCVEGVVKHNPVTQCNGRQDTDPIMWLAMELVQIDSDIRTRTRNHLRDTRNNSHIDNEWIIARDPKDTKYSHKQKTQNCKGSISLEWKT